MAAPKPQRHALAKRVLLAPVEPFARRWALSGSPSPLKARALERLVEPKLVAEKRRFQRRVEPGVLFEGTTDNLISRHVYLFGNWQPNLTDVIRARLEPDRVFVDVGANGGWFTLQAIGGPVVAIEPTVAAKELRRNLELNAPHRARVVEAAVWSSAGELRLETELERFSMGVKGTVPCDTLQGLLTAAELDRVRLVKIDIDGGETEVVKALDLSAFPDDCEFVIEVNTETAPPVFDRFNGWNAYTISTSYRVRHYMLEPPTEPQPISGPPEGEWDVLLTRQGIHRAD